jgi:hypothetical protein
MALKIVREMELSPGSKGFRFRNHEDTIADEKQYKKGRTFERARFRQGSLGQKIYERLSSSKRAA